MICAIPFVIGLVKGGGEGSAPLSPFRGNTVSVLDVLPFAFCLRLHAQCIHDIVLGSIVWIMIIMHTHVHTLIHTYSHTLTHTHTHSHTLTHTHSHSLTLTLTHTHSHTHTHTLTRTHTAGHPTECATEHAGGTWQTTGHRGSTAQQGSGAS